MNKQKLLKILNPILFLDLLFHIFTIVILKFFDLEGFDLIHEINGYILIGLILIHFTLNWQWIKAQFFKKKA